MMTYVLYHNPRCSKSREALEMLRSRGIEPQIRDYLLDPPDRAELLDLHAALGLHPREWIRSSEDEFRALGLAGVDDADRLVEAVLAHPRLLQRPILRVADKACVGRPVERLFELLPAQE